MNLFQGSNRISHYWERIVLISMIINIYKLCVLFSTTVYSLHVPVRFNALLMPHPRDVHNIESFVAFKRDILTLVSYIIKRNNHSINISILKKGTLL